MGSLKGFRFYPAQWMYGINAALAIVVGTGFLSQTASATVTTMATAGTGLIAAFLARPFDVGLATTLFTSGLVGVAGFGFHANDQVISGAGILFSLLASFVMHNLATPKAGSPAQVFPELAPLGAKAA